MHTVTRTKKKMTEEEGDMIETKANIVTGTSLHRMIRNESRVYTQGRNTFTFRDSCSRSCMMHSFLSRRHVHRAHDIRDVFVKEVETEERALEKKRQKMLKRRAKQARQTERRRADKDKKKRAPVVPIFGMFTFTTNKSQ
jgi:hypothetical protein